MAGLRLATDDQFDYILPPPAECLPVMTRVRAVRVEKDNHMQYWRLFSIIIQLVLASAIGYAAPPSLPLGHGAVVPDHLASESVLWEKMEEWDDRDSYLVTHPLVPPTSLEGKATGELITLLCADDRWISHVAAECLCRRQDPRVAVLLLDRLTTLADQTRRQAILRALSNTGAPALGLLQTMAVHGSSALRCEVLTALGRLYHPEALPTLRGALADPDPAVARCAAGILAETFGEGKVTPPPPPPPPPPVSPALPPAELDDANPWTRMDAWGRWLASGDQRARQQARARGLKDPAYSVRCAIIRWLAKDGEVPAVMTALQTALCSADTSERRAAIRALRAYPLSPRIRALGRQVLYDIDLSVRAPAAELLACDPDFGMRLWRQSYAADPYFREHLLRGLSSTRDRRVATLLLADFPRERNTRVKLSLFDALCALRDPRTVPVLFAAMRQTRHHFHRQPQPDPTRPRYTPDCERQYAMGSSYVDGRSYHSFEGRLRYTLIILTRDREALVIPYVSHPQAIVRYTAISVLDALRGPAAWAVLCDRLRDPVIEVRAASVYALIRLGDPRAVPSLVRLAAREPDYSVRRAAVAALGAAGDSRAVPLLIHLLRTGSVGIRRAAAQALGRMKAPSATGALLEALEEKDYDVRAAAARALGVNPTAAALEPLLAAARDADAAVRIAAVEALSSYRHPDILPLLTATLYAPSPARRAQAAAGIEKLGDPHAVDALLYSLHDPDASVREAAVQALGALGECRAIPRLIDALMRGTFGADRALVRLTHLHYGADVLRWRRWWMRQDGASLVGVGVGERGGGQHDDRADEQQDGANAQLDGGKHRLVVGEAGGHREEVPPDEAQGDEG